MPGGGDRGGQLALIATPIGNLGDITSRAIDALASADRLLAEDTRRARALLNHLGIAGKPVDRLDAHTERQRLGRWIERLQAGERLALVTDAGTPLVADPGAELVRAAAAAGVSVTPIPGPSAVMAALAASGLVTGPFWFVGFLPRSGAGRRRAMARIGATEEAVVLFESPRRVSKMLAELAAQMPDREAVLAREMTKIHEEFIRGTVAQVAAALCPEACRGEMTLVLGPASAPVERAVADDGELDRLLAALVADGLRPKEAAKVVARQTGLAVRDLYQRIAGGRGPKRRSGR